MSKNIKTNSGNYCGTRRWGYNDLSIEQTLGFHGMNIIVKDIQ